MHRIPALGLLALVAATLVVLPWAVRAAQDQEPPVFRGGTAFVRVDVYPLKDGRPVEGLTADDFEVFEDGEPQQVEAFDFIRFDTAILDSERIDPVSVADSEQQAADPNNRLFVVYLDPYNTRVEDAVRLASPVRAFFERTIGATDLYAVMTPESAPSRLTFGRRLESLDSDLDAFWRSVQISDHAVATPRDDVEQRLLECVANDVTSGPTVLRLHREEMLLTSLEGLMHRLRGIREERKNVLFLSGGWVPSAEPQTLAARGSGDIPTIGTGPTGRLGMGNQQPVGRDRSWCDQQLARLSGADYQKRFRDLLELARQSNVSFYPVDVQGLRVDASRGAVDTLRTLAENTNGLAVTNTNDLTMGVRRLTDSLSAYYLLGYYSTNPTANGRYRRIEVKVKQPGISVQARPGYFAPTAEMLAAATAPAPEGPSAVDEALGQLARSRSDTDLFTYGVQRGDQLRVVVELASRQVSRWRNGGDVSVTVSPASGTAATLEASIEPGARSVVASLPVADLPGPWRVDARLTGSGDPLDGTSEAAPPDGTLFGAPIPYRANPSPRSTPKPVADFQYRPQERIHVEWPLLGPVDRKAVRLLDREGEPLPLTPTLSDVDVEGAPGVAADLVLSALAAGDYVIELTGSGGGTSDQALVAFRVIR